MAHVEKNKYSTAAAHVIGVPLSTPPPPEHSFARPPPNSADFNGRQKGIEEITSQNTN